MEYKKIEGFPYEIREDGALRRISNKRQLKLSVGSEGYYQTSLSLNGKPTNVIHHRLLATAFIPNPNNYPQVNHIDGDKTNNSLSNLEWCSAKQNISHAIRTGLKGVYGEDNPNSKLKLLDVNVIKEALAKGFSGASIGRYFNVGRNAISYIKRGIRWA